MTMTAKNSFVLYTDYKQSLLLLTDEERGRLLMALMDYCETGQAPKLSGAAMMAFSFIAAQMDRDAQKYREKCQKRSESGKKGGRPAKQPDSEKAKKANAFSGKQVKAKKADNDNDNEDDNENDNENESVIPPCIPPRGDADARSTKGESISASGAPTLDEVKAYARANALNDVSPQRFYDYYAARGWRLKDGPVMDWQALMRSWQMSGVPHGGAKRDYAQRTYAPDELEQAYTDIMQGDV